MALDIALYLGAATSPATISRKPFGIGLPIYGLASRAGGGLSGGEIPVRWNQRLRVQAGTIERVHIYAGERCLHAGGALACVSLWLWLCV